MADEWCGLVQVILMDHVDWLDEAAASLLAARLAEQVPKSCLSLLALQQHWFMLQHVCYPTVLYIWLAKASLQQQLHHYQGGNVLLICLAIA